MQMRLMWMLGSCFITKEEIEDMIKGVQLKIKEYVDMLREDDIQFLIQICTLLQDRIEMTGRL